MPPPRRNSLPLVSGSAFASQYTVGGLTGVIVRGPCPAELVEAPNADVSVYGLSGPIATAWGSSAWARVLALDAAGDPSGFELVIPEDGPYEIDGQACADSALAQPYFVAPGVNNAFTGYYRVSFVLVTYGDDPLLHTEQGPPGPRTVLRQDFIPIPGDTTTANRVGDNRGRAYFRYGFPFLAAGTRLTLKLVGGLVGANTPAGTNTVTETIDVTGSWLRYRKVCTPAADQLAAPSPPDPLPPFGAANGPLPPDA